MTNVKRRSFQVGTRLVILLLIVVPLAGCMKVIVTCPSPGEDEFIARPHHLMMKPSCEMDGDKCLDKPSGCVCRR